jgi:hypothetical protein
MKDWKGHVSHFGWSLESAKGNISAIVPCIQGDRQKILFLHRGLSSNK